MEKLKTFEEFLSNKNAPVLSEGKSDFMARYDKSDITIKKGYKHASGDELTKMYDELGKLLKKFDIPVKSVTIVTESLDVNEHHGDEWPDAMLAMSLSSFLDGVKEMDEIAYNEIEQVIGRLVDNGFMR